HFSPHPPAPTDHATLSLHDALPISSGLRSRDSTTMKSLRSPSHFSKPIHDIGAPTCSPSSAWSHERASLCQLETLSLTQPFKDADRKSTRLNSSHVKISYAVFCLKK